MSDDFALAGEGQRESIISVVNISKPQYCSPCCCSVWDKDALNVAAVQLYEYMKKLISVRVYGELWCRREIERRSRHATRACTVLYLGGTKADIAVRAMRAASDWLQ